MSSIFCCFNIQPYRPRRLDHEQKFQKIMDWATFPRSSSIDQEHDDHTKTISQLSASYAVQIVRQVNFGPVESKRYFIAVADNADGPFIEVTETDLKDANYEKLNSYVPFPLSSGVEFHEKFHCSIEPGTRTSSVAPITGSLKSIYIRRVHTIGIRFVAILLDLLDQSTCRTTVREAFGLRSSLCRTQ